MTQKTLAPDVRHPITSTTSHYGNHHTSTGDTSILVTQQSYNCVWHTTGRIQRSTEVRIKTHEGCPHGFLFVSCEDNPLEDICGESAACTSQQANISVSSDSSSESVESDTSSSENSESSDEEEVRRI